MIGFDVKKALYPFQNIGSVSKNIFQVLIRLIGDVRKQPECRDIGESLSIETADVAVVKFSSIIIAAASVIFFGINRLVAKSLVLPAGI